MELTKEYFDQQLEKFVTKEDFEQLANKENIGELQTVVSELKTDMSNLKTDVSAFQDDIRSVKFTLQEINQTLAALNKRDKEDSDSFAKTLVQHEERLIAVEQTLKNLKLKQI